MQDNAFINRLPIELLQRIIAMGCEWEGDSLSVRYALPLQRIVSPPPHLSPRDTRLDGFRRGKAPSFQPPHLKSLAEVGSHVSRSWRVAATSSNLLRYMLVRITNADPQMQQLEEYFSTHYNVDLDLQVKILANSSLVGIIEVLKTYRAHIRSLEVEVVVSANDHAICKELVTAINDLGNFPSLEYLQMSLTGRRADPTHTWTEMLPTLMPKALAIRRISMINLYIPLAIRMNPSVALEQDPINGAPRSTFRPRAVEFQWIAHIGCPPPAIVAEYELLQVESIRLECHPSITTMVTERLRAPVMRVLILALISHTGIRWEKAHEWKFKHENYFFPCLEILRIEGVLSRRYGPYFTQNVYAPALHTLVVSDIIQPHHNADLEGFVGNGAIYRRPAGNNGSEFTIKYDGLKLNSMLLSAFPCQNISHLAISRSSFLAREPPIPDPSDGPETPNPPEDEYPQNELSTLQLPALRSLSLLGPFPSLASWDHAFKHVMHQIKEVHLDASSLIGAEVESLLVQFNAVEKLTVATHGGDKDVLIPVLERLMLQRKQQSPSLKIFILDQQISDTLCQGEGVDYVVRSSC
jgi:hypothetical protein